MKELVPYAWCRFRLVAARCQIQCRSPARVAVGRYPIHRYRSLSVRAPPACLASNTRLATRQASWVLEHAACVHYVFIRTGFVAHTHAHARTHARTRTHDTRTHKRRGLQLYTRAHTLPNHIDRLSTEGEENLLSLPSAGELLQVIHQKPAENESPKTAVSSRSGAYGDQSKLLGDVRKRYVCLLFIDVCIRCN